jgi:hypothetical protein
LMQSDYMKLNARIAWQILQLAESGFGFCVALPLASAVAKSPKTVQNDYITCISRGGETPAIYDG